MKREERGKWSGEEQAKMKKRKREGKGGIRAEDGAGREEEEIKERGWEKERRGVELCAVQPSPKAIPHPADSKQDPLYNSYSTALWFEPDTFRRKCHLSNHTARTTRFIPMKSNRKNACVSCIVATGCLVYVIVEKAWDRITKEARSFYFNTCGQYPTSHDNFITKPVTSPVVKINKGGEIGRYVWLFFAQHNKWKRKLGKTISHSKERQLGFSKVMEGER